MGMCASTVPSCLAPAPISEHLQQEETNEPEEISQDDGKPQQQPPPGDDEILEMYKHHDRVKNRYTHHICTRGTQFDSWLQLLLLPAAASHFVCALPAPAHCSFQGRACCPSQTAEHVDQKNVTQAQQWQHVAQAEQNGRGGSNETIVLKQSC